MKKLRTWFLSGISVILPIGLTVFVLVKLFNFVDGILQNYVAEAFGHVIPGLGLILVILIILLIGAFTSNFIGKKIVHHAEQAFGKIPLIKIIFNPIREIVRNLSSKSSGSFQKVVMVDFPMKGVKSIGFITSDKMALNNEKKLSVFIPTTPNPTNGFLVIVEVADVEVLDISVEEGLKMIISMGSSMCENINTIKS
ncbi:MAG TPA: DUF502 domain-containing protein [Thermotogota bacterium]|nr:DUF502 domain-containing protein [Thermotogota bacterium]HPJ89991.1 DUF502 domain-containing protein [Thermotogota bacterium]HPR97208.1 DUF502 domain-containing protein [Thermotogota bacterium]